jgi:hypothetical protein
MADPRIIELIKDYLKIGQIDQKAVNAHTSAFYSYLSGYEKILKDYADAVQAIESTPVEQQTAEEKEEALGAALKIQIEALVDLNGNELALLFNLLKDNNNQYTPEYANDKELDAIKAALEEIHKPAASAPSTFSEATADLHAFLSAMSAKFENDYKKEVAELQSTSTHLLATHLATDEQCAACAEYIATQGTLPELAHLQDANVLQNISASALPADLANWEHWDLYDINLAGAVRNTGEKTQPLPWETLSALYKLKTTHEFIKAQGKQSDVAFLLEKQAQTGKTFGDVSYAENRNNFTETRRYPDKIDVFVVEQNKDMTQQESYKALDAQTATLATTRMFLAQSSTAQDAKTVTKGFIQTYMGLIKEQHNLIIQSYTKTFENFLNETFLFTYLIPPSVSRDDISPSVMGGAAIETMIKRSTTDINIKKVTASLPAAELAKLRKIFPRTGAAKNTPDSLKSFLADYVKNYQNMLVESKQSALTPLQKRELGKLCKALAAADPNITLSISFDESPPASPSLNSPSKAYNVNAYTPNVTNTSTSSSSSSTISITTDPPVTATTTATTATTATTTTTTATATTATATANVTTTNTALNTPITVDWSQVPHTETAGTYYQPAQDGTIALTDLVPNVKNANDGIDANIRVGYSFWRDALPNSKKRPFVVIDKNNKRHELDVAFFEGLENESLKIPANVTRLNTKLKNLLAQNDSGKERKVDALLTQYSQQAVSAAVANPFNKTLESYGTDTTLLATEESTQAIEISFNAKDNIVLNVEYSDLKIKTLGNVTENSSGLIVNIPNSAIQSTLELRGDDFYVSPGKYSNPTLAGMYNRTTSVGDFTDNFKHTERIFVRDLNAKLQKTTITNDYYFNDINALRQLRILLELPMPADLSADNLKQILTEGLKKNPSPTRLDLIATLMNYYTTPEKKRDDVKFTGDMDRLFDKYSLNKKLVNIIERENVRRTYPQGKKGFIFYWKMAALKISDFFQPIRVAILHSSSTFNDTSDAALFAAAKKAADNGEYDVAFETLNTLGTTEQAYVDYKQELKQKFERKLLARASAMADPNSNIAKAMTVQDIYNINKTLNLAGSDLNKTVTIENEHVQAFGLHTPKDKLLFQLDMAVEKRALQAEKQGAPNAGPLRTYATKLEQQLKLPAIDRTTPPADVDAVLEAMVEKTKVSASTSSTSTSAMMTQGNFVQPVVKVVGSPSKKAINNPNLSVASASTDPLDNQNLQTTASQQRQDSTHPKIEPNPLTGQVIIPGDPIITATGKKTHTN